MNNMAVYNEELAKLRGAVAQLDTVEEAKELADQAAAAQVWARRVRLGQESVNHAAEVKIRAERRAGEILTVLRGEAGRLPNKTVVSSDISRNQSHEWQELAAIPQDEFESALAAETDAGQLTRNGVTRRAMSVHYSSATPQWETPQDLFDLLAQEFEFDVDVCATTENAKCARFFTALDDGLSQDWTGVCWMNPPYGDEIGRWVAKASNSAAAGATVVCLVPARVDTAWWWDYCRFGEVRFLRGRLRFGGGTTGAPFPSAVVVFPRPARVVWWER